MTSELKSRKEPHYYEPDWDVNSVDEYLVSQSHNYESSVHYESSSVNCESSEEDDKEEPKHGITLLGLLVLAGFGYCLYVQKYTCPE